MWAPADLFSPALNLVLLPMKRTVSYLSEHLTVLALALFGVAVLIALVTTLGNRRASRS